MNITLIAILMNGLLNGLAIRAFNSFWSRLTKNSDSWADQGVGLFLIVVLAIILYSLPSLVTPVMQWLAWSPDACFGLCALYLFSLTCLFDWHVSWLRFRYRKIDVRQNLLFALLMAYVFTQPTCLSWLI